MVAQDSVHYRIRQVLAKVLHLDPEGSFEEKTLLKDHLGVDSLDLFEIATEIESEFGIEVPTSPRGSLEFGFWDHGDEARWKTVGDIVSYVESKLPVTFTQADVDGIVARAKQLGAGAGLDRKMSHLSLSNFAEPHGPEVLAMLIVGGWDEKWDLIHATHSLIEFMTKRGTVL